MLKIRCSKEMLQQYGYTPVSKTSKTKAVLDDWVAHSCSHNGVPHVCFYHPKTHLYVIVNTEHGDPFLCFELRMLKQFKFLGLPVEVIKEDCDEMICAGELNEVEVETLDAMFYSRTHFLNMPMEDRTIDSTWMTIFFWFLYPSEFARKSPINAAISLYVKRKKMVPVKIPDLLFY